MPLARCSRASIGLTIARDAPGASRVAHGRITSVKGGWNPVRGVLVKGYGVASGPSADYPYGALERQFPVFKTRGLDLTSYYRGTLNVDISPATFDLENPEFTFRGVRWTDLHPPEHFSFSRCRIRYAGGEYKGWIYFPHPETKRRNFQNLSLLEVIADLIPKVKYGDALEVFVNPKRVVIGPISAHSRARV